MNAVPTPRSALHRHSGAKDTRDELTTWLTTERAELSRLENEGIAADGTTYTTNDRSRYTFSVARLHDKGTSQGICDR